METKTDTPNNTTAQQPAAPAVAPKPAEPAWYEEAWDGAKALATYSTVNFINHFAIAAGVTLGACVVLKCFGAFDQKSAE